MLNSLLKMQQVKSSKDINEKDTWLQYLYETREKNYNSNNVKSLSEISNKSVFNYVMRSLKILNEENLDENISFYIEETLKWMDASKCGSKKIRTEWISNGYDLLVHNIGSSQIYKNENKNYNKEVELLIRTHGLIGQFAKGEVNLSKNKELYSLIEDNIFSKDQLKSILYSLNKCIIKAISDEVWEKSEKEITSLIEKIICNDFEEENFYNETYIIKRLSKLRKNLTEEELKILNKLLKSNKDIKEKIGFIFENLELWYFDSTFQSFNPEEIVKIFYIIGTEIFGKNFEHLSFENVMKNIYLDYNGQRVVNLYEERIIEKYLKSISFSMIKNKDIKNQNININLEFKNHTILFDFNFSIVAKKLIEFCEIAYETDSLYNKAVFMLYDLFEFRRDTYDRFYNEIKYLKIMNESLSQKAKILDYITGNNILDIGPGGGALMDLITDKLPEKNVFGIDISQNVIDELNSKKTKENRKWNVIKGDALELNNYFGKDKIDSIIYSSIIHELFSYIETDGKKFNHKTIEIALTSAFDILKSKGRIIIRDGIMTENKELNRIIRFKNKDDMKILNRYCKDFKGREITYTLIKENEVMMKVNDAMEFLYTYTWGENSYSLEVKEQFGYLTPNEYVDFIQRIFKDKCKIIECLHFLQDGYEEHLFEKIEFYDENYAPVHLPDSTCIIVIEKN